MRRILPVLGLCALAFAVDSQPASAEITYPWCAQYSGGGDGAARNCGSGPMNNAAPRCPVSAAIVKSMRCTAAPSRG